MIIHCTICDHEWHAAVTEPCWSCGVEGTEPHLEECYLYYCDWCGGEGTQIASDYMDIEVDLGNVKGSIRASLLLRDDNNGRNSN